jgi:hypothetical protein
VVRVSACVWVFSYRINSRLKRTHTWLYYSFVFTHISQTKFKFERINSLKVGCVCGLLWISWNAFYLTKLLQAVLLLTIWWIWLRLLWCCRLRELLPTLDLVLCKWSWTEYQHQNQKKFTNIIFLFPHASQNSNYWELGKRCFFEVTEVIKVHGFCWVRSSDSHNYHREVTFQEFELRCLTLRIWTFPY